MWLVLPSWDREMQWDDQGMWIAAVGVCQGDVSWAVQWVQDMQRAERGTSN